MAEPAPIPTRTQPVEPRRVRLALALVIGLSSAAFGKPNLEGASKDRPGSARLSDAELTRRAYDIVRRRRLTSVRLDCLGFQLSRRSSPGRDSVDVREVHNARCKGDPDTKPRLFSIYFGRTSGFVGTDAYHPGEARIDPLR